MGGGGYMHDRSVLELAIGPCVRSIARRRSAIFAPALARHRDFLLVASCGDVFFADAFIFRVDIHPYSPFFTPLLSARYRCVFAGWRVKTLKPGKVQCKDAWQACKDAKDGRC